MKYLLFSILLLGICGCATLGKVNTHEVKCYRCGKKLAWWSMYDNIQYEEEWECKATMRRDITKNKVFKAYNSKGKRLKSIITRCSITYNTQYCRECAYKMQFKCLRPHCKGRIEKVRSKR